MEDEIPLQAKACGSFLSTRMKKLNLLVMGTTFPRWENDTEATFVKDLSYELSKYFNVNVLVPHYKGLKLYDSKEKLKIYRFIYFYPTSLEKLAYGGILPNLKKNPLLWIETPFLFLSELIKTFEIIKKENIEVLHTHWIFPQGLVGAISKKFFKIKHLSTIHAGDIIALKKIPFSNYIINFIVKNTDKITSVSSFGKNKLLEIANKSLKEEINKKVRILPMGTYLEQFKKRKLKRGRVKNILFVGRLAEKKGVSYLIKAISLLNKEVRLLIIGDGPLKKDLLSFTNKLNLKNKIEFLGYKTGKEKLKYFFDADLLVVPSIVTKIGDTEGLPVVIMEGLASGLPIIATDVGGIKEIIKNGYNGLIIKEKNSKEIANKIKLVIENNKFKRRLSINAKKSSRNYDWGYISKKYADLIFDLANN